MAAHQRGTLLTACALLWLGLLFSCSDVDGCPSKIVDKVKSAGKAVGTRFKLIRKKDKIVDSAGDAAKSVSSPKGMSAVGHGVDCSNPFIPCNPNAMSKIGNAAGGAGQKMSRKAKIAAMFSRKVSEDGTKHFSSAQKKGIAAVAVAGVGTAAAAVIVSKKGNDNDKDKGKGQDGQPENSGPQQGTTVNAAAQPKAQRRTVSEKGEDENDE